MKAAKRLGLHVITLAVDPGRYEYVAAEETEAIRVDTGNIDALIRECYGLRIRYDIVGITGAASDEVSVTATVGKLCRHFGLPGPNPVSIEQCSDKFSQRQLLSQAGVSVPAYHLAANGKQAECFADDIGLPVVVKPAFGNGRTRARLCRNAQELAEHTDDLFGATHIARSSPRVLVEEYLQGTQYIINMFEKEIIGIAAIKLDPMPGLIWSECTYPAVLTDDEYVNIYNVSLICLRTLGLNWGPTNIELRSKNHGPVVIGVSPHLPGSPAPELVQLAYGVDLISEHIKLVTGVRRSLRRSPTDIASARFLIGDRDGALDCMDGRQSGGCCLRLDQVERYIEPKATTARKGGC
ncbi:hypothetical protein A9K66_24805 [Mesorhizobium sp. AA23]|nr:hypothetical protein [Mesorhizobium japonicum]OBQ95825.1 hypothetical protein A9K66_24805 [Mesorhizobium sp. AA23]